MSDSSSSSTVSLFNSSSSSSSSSSSLSNVTSAPPTAVSLMDSPSRSFVQHHANELTIGLVVGIVGSMLFSLLLYYIVVKAKRAKLRAAQGGDGERGHVTDSWNSSSQLEPQQEPTQTTSIQRPPPSQHQLQATHGGRTPTHASSAAAT